MIRYLFLVFLLLTPLTSQGVDIPLQLQFADRLVAEGDHYRAITEYKRFIFQQPESKHIPQARLAIAQSLISGKRWAQADSSLENLSLMHPTSPEAAEGRLLYADIAYQRGHFGLARERYRSLAKSSPTEKNLDYANFRIGWTFLEQDNPQKARTSFNSLPSAQKEEILAALAGYEELRLKSPLVAGTLSALLPGLGQAYTGRLQQAAVAFLLNSAFIFGALEAIDNENYAVGGIFLFFEIGWYGGNVYNAVNNAHKFNQRLKHEYKKEMRSKLNLQVGLHEHTPLFGLNYRF